MAFPAIILTLGTGRSYGRCVLILKCLPKFGGSFNGTMVKREESTIILPRFSLHRLEAGPSQKTVVNKEEAIKYYREMQTIRRMETVIGNLYKAKTVLGFCHLYNGQEACAVGLYNTMRPQDTLITSYRAHSWALLMNKFNVMGVIAELAGRAAGISIGRGGSMHVFGPNFYGGQGIVGAQVPLGTGIALALQYLKKKAVSFTLFGEGAANNGQVFEAFNMCKLWNLPCIYVCENNTYGMGTSAIRASANTEFYKRGDYIPGIRGDGMSVLSVREMSRFAIDYCLAGKGPILLELMTYRYFGHSLSDPGTTYRTRDEVQKMRDTNDPIKNFTKVIIDNKIATADELKKIDKEVKKLVDDNKKLALKEKVLPVSGLTQSLYKTNLGGDVRGRTPWTPFKHSDSKKK